MSTDLARTEPPTGAQWARQRDESTEEFDAFSQWLALIPRPAPALCGPGIGELAARNDWLGRAQAYDAACDLLRMVPDGSPSGMVRTAVELWAQAVAIEASKVAKAAMASKSPVIDQAQQLSFFQKFAELKQAFSSDREEDYEWTGTPEELDQYLAMSAKMRRKQ